MKVKHKKLIITLSAIGGTILVLVGFFFGYVSVYYKADDYAKSMLVSSDTVEVSEGEGGYIFKPKDEIKAGFVFYPGGKVEYTAYAPFMHMLAENGIYSVIPHMTFNLAFFSSSAADKVLANHSDLPWYIGGHSLGGVAATSYLGKKADDYKGLVMLGSYSTTDLSSTNLKTLSFLASNDKVLKMDSYNKNKHNLPNLQEVTIEGGIHSYFGSYGLQKGDGTPDITCEEQQSILASNITNFIIGE